MVLCSDFLTAWQQLRGGQINCQQALQLLRDEQGMLTLSLLDDEVCQRFFQLFPEGQELPPVVPLLLWRNCYYLGSPVALTPDLVQSICDRTLTQDRKSTRLNSSHPSRSRMPSSA